MAEANFIYQDQKLFTKSQKLWDWKTFNQKSLLIEGKNHKTGKITKNKITPKGGKTKDY